MKLDGIRFEGGTGMSRLWEMISSRVFNCLLIVRYRYWSPYPSRQVKFEFSNQSFRVVP